MPKSRRRTRGKRSNHQRPKLEQAPKLSVQATISGPDKGGELEPTEVDEPSKRQIYPTLAIVSAIYAALIFGGHYLFPWVVNPGSTSGIGRVVAAVVVGVPVGLSMWSLTLVLLASGLGRRSNVARRYTKTMAERAAYGAVLGTFLGIRVALEGLTESKRTGETVKWDLIDVVGRVATLGTLIGLSMGIFLGVKAVRKAMEHLTGDRELAITAVLLPGIVAAAWTFSIVSLLINDLGWQQLD